ncbi:MAG: hypothetical protein BAJALOKI1v1_160031 [Promethearchaeota archaeon]|nr:MAG: hypothetical protein BAJALOKI1v1_160031 [Candidatus Lokiarchaeota archaeon]
MIRTKIMKKTKVYKFELVNLHTYYLLYKYSLEETIIRR